MYTMLALRNNHDKADLKTLMLYCNTYVLPTQCSVCFGPMSSISVRHRAEMPEIGPMSYAEIGPMSVPSWPRSGRYWANIVCLSGNVQRILAIHNCSVKPAFVGLTGWQHGVFCQPVQCACAKVTSRVGKHVLLGYWRL